MTQEQDADRWYALAGRRSVGSTARGRTPARRSTGTTRSSQLRGVASAASRSTLTAHFLLTRARVARARRTGSSAARLVYVASKNAFAPGRRLRRLLGQRKPGCPARKDRRARGRRRSGVRSNVVNPDAVFERLAPLVGRDAARTRGRGHGVAPRELESFYADAQPVAAARHRQQTSPTPSPSSFPTGRGTTGTVLPVDGGVAAAFPR